MLEALATESCPLDTSHNVNPAVFNPMTPKPVAYYQKKRTSGLSPILDARKGERGDRFPPPQG